MNKYLKYFRFLEQGRCENTGIYGVLDETLAIK